MEEIVLKESDGQYFQSASKLLEGKLILTNKRVLFSGVLHRSQMSHGLVGNVIKDQLEKKMGYADTDEKQVFSIPLKDAKVEMKGGMFKKLIFSDASGNSWKVINVKKAERVEWPSNVEDAKKQYENASAD